MMISPKPSVTYLGGREASVSASASTAELEQLVADVVGNAVVRQEFIILFHVAADFCFPAYGFEICRSAGVALIVQVISEILVPLCRYRLFGK